MPRAVPPANVTEGLDAVAGVATTYTLALREVFQGNIGGVGDIDWVRIDLKAGQTYVLSLWGTEGGIEDTVLTLRDSDGMELLRNDDIGGGSSFSRITYTAATTGTYYLEAAAFGRETGAYRLRASTDVFTLPEIATQLAEMDWGEPWPLAFAAGPGSTLTVNLTALTAGGQQLARWALEAWSRVTGLVFAETTLTGASITFDDDGSGAFAGPSSYNPATGIINRSSVNISTSWLASYGTTIDSYSYTTYVHEIGHALGIGHPGNYNGGATYGVNNHFRNDSTLMTVMSYFTPRENDFYGNHGGDPVMPMPADVLAMWTLYGQPPVIQGGNTTWGAGSNLGGTLGRLFAHVFDGAPADPGFYSGRPVFLTMTDTGGLDTLNLQRFSAAATVDLNPGGISTSTGWKAVLVTGPQTAIEVVRTGSGDDRITGNSAMAVAHQIFAGAGNDTVTGGIGADTIVGGPGNDQIKGGNGRDLLFSDGVQLRHFSDLSAQVHRLYQAVLGREPDLGGHRGWTSAVALGEQTMATLRNTFIASQEFQNIYGTLDDAGLIARLYQNVLGRSASTPEIDAWMDFIAAGNSRAKVVQGFADSPEFVTATAAVTAAWTATRDPESWTDDLFRLYRATLARDPDLAGLQRWASELAVAPVLQTVAAGFVASREFQNVYGALNDSGFVSLLYQNVLGRIASAGEIDGWLARIAEGDSRAKVVVGFSQSTEFVNATKGDLVGWVRGTGVTGRLEGGPGSDTLAGGFGADTFVFNRAGGAATDRVLGFEAWDLLELRGFGFGSAEAALARFSQVGSDVVFEDSDLRVVFEAASLDMFDTTTIALWS